jgi:hypothetical protein
MTHHNQTNDLTTWFLNLPLDESIDNTKAQSLSFESKTKEKLKKVISKKEKQKSANGVKSGKPSKMAKKS